MAILYQFSPPTEAVLRRAGWSPGRRVDTEPYEALYRQEGFPVYPFVIEFLSSFGGITVYSPRNPRFPKFKLDPFEAVEHSGSGWSDIWKEEQLIPIGTGPLWTMFVYPDGTVVNDADFPGMIPVGNSLTEAIEHLCHDRSLFPV